MFTQDGEEWKYYKKGALQSFTGTNNNWSSNHLAISAVWIGRSVHGDFYFNGLMSDIRLYNRALSEAEVLDLYNATTNIKQ